jgi:hypothetical protein
MSTTTKSVKAKAVALLCCGGLFVLGFGGSCLPNNFWANMWESALTASGDVVIDTFVIDPLEDALATGD